MRRRDEEVLHPILRLRVHATKPTAATPLGSVRVDRESLHITLVRHGHDHVLLDDQVFDVERPDRVRDLASAIVAVLLRDLCKLVFEDVHADRLGTEDAAQLGDDLADLGQFSLDLFGLESGESSQTHVENRLRLTLGQLEPLLQLGRSDLGVLRGSDELDDLVDIVDGDLEALEDVLAIQRPGQIEFGAPHDDDEAMVDVVLKHLAKRQYLRLAVHERQHDDPERGLHLRMLVQTVQHDFRHRITLELDDDPHAVAVRLVTQVPDVGQLLVAHELGDLLD